MLFFFKSLMLKGTIIYHKKIKRKIIRSIAFIYDFILKSTSIYLENVRIRVIGTGVRALIWLWHFSWNVQHPLESGLRNPKESSSPENNPWRAGFDSVESSRCRAGGAGINIFPSDPRSSIEGHK